MRIPKYYIVKRALSDMIAELPTGTAIPTERDLAIQFDTSRTTIRQAITDLVVDGRLERTQGRGTFVSRPKVMRVRPLTSFSQERDSEGWRPGSVLRDISDVVAQGDLATNLQVPEGTVVHRVERIRTASGEPIAYEVAHVPGPLPRLAEELAARGSLYATLRDAYGIDLVTVEDTVETTLADPVQADLLGIDTGLPMLLTHRTAWDAEGRVAEWTRSVFRGDRFRFVSRHRLQDIPDPGSAPIDLGSEQRAS